MIAFRRRAWSSPYCYRPANSILKAFNEFIHERETKATSDPSVRIFDEVIMAKKARGRPGITSGLSRMATIRQSHGASATISRFAPPPRQAKVPDYLGDVSEHIWRTASVPLPKGQFPGEYHAIVTRTPTRLDRSLMREPRAIQGAPRVEHRSQKSFARKQVPNVFGPTPPS
jgi:hypothetical protein